uniref:ankyrin repeat domain-containing protein 20B-like isoform X2 n=1 Tax=Myodes glareolus TaxID=447135 RepID=UPI0020204B99|nr:ankyrin repeat domain-containing protein 20B-like isoform X2 [Myodes glareolus]
MRRNIWSRKTGQAPGRSSTRLWTACLGFGCAGGDSPPVPRYLSGYCAVGQIHQAASVGAVDTVERFLTNGVNGVNDTDKKNRTALHYACAHGQLGVVTLLIEWNCDINACDDDNCTPLIKASQHQHEECVVLLLQQGAEANAVDARGNTALHYAVHNENTAIASQLLEHGANIEAKTKDGFTPLLLALQQNKDQIVELLIEKGANIHTMFHRTADQYPRDRKTQCVKSPHGTLQDEVALRTITLWQKTFQTRKTNLPHGHQQKTSHKQKGKKKCDRGHTHAHSGCLTMETDKEAQQREQLNKVLKTKFQTSSESFEKTPPLGIFKAEEERNYGLQEPEVTLESSNDRTACAVASAGGDAASGSTSTSKAVSASTSNASAAAAPASAALAAAAVVDFSNATVNAAVAAVTATTDHKGIEPILQRHSGTVSKKGFALAGKEEHNKSPLKQNKKRVNDGCFYGKLKTEFRGGERQYHEEFGRQLWSSLYHRCYNEEVGQHEMFLENLNMNSKALKNSVTQEAQLQEERQREGILNSSRVEHQLWKLEVECFKLEDSVKNQAEEIEEIENQLLREDLIGNKKKQQNKLIQSTQSLACTLDQEKEKTEELEKELQGFMEVLKVIRKKLNECENRELHFYEDMKSRTFEMLRHETQGIIKGNLTLTPIMA